MGGPTIPTQSGADVTGTSIRPPEHPHAASGMHRPAPDSGSPIPSATPLELSKSARFRAIYGMLVAEIIVIAACAPFLLFPTLVPLATLGAVCLLGTWWLGRLIRTRQGPPVTPISGPLLLWSVMIAVGILVSAYPEETLPKATSLVLGLAVWRMLASMPADDGRTVRWAAAGLALMSLAIVGLGIPSTNWSNKIPILAPALARLPSRLTAPPEAPDQGVNANQLGGMLALLLPWALSEWAGVNFGRRNKRRMPPVSRLPGLALATLCVLVLGGMLMLTQSRSAWFGAAIGSLALTLLWGLTSDQRRWRRATLALATVAILGAAASGSIIGADRLTAWWDAATTSELETSLTGSVSLSGRIEIWSRALYAIQDFSFTGCGLGTFREVIWLLYPLFTISPTTDIAHAHNIFLQVALDTGVPGLIAYLALLGVAGTMAWRVARASPAHRPLALGLLGGLIALHAYGLTDALAPGSKPGLIFWTMLGLLTALRRHATLAHTHESATLGCTQT